MAWWCWLIIGLSLLSVELIFPSGFFIFFFGVSAIIVGFSLSLFGDFAVWIQLAIWAVGSVTLLAILRKPLMGRLNLNLGATPGQIVGEFVVIEGEIEAGEIGSGTMRGSSWKVQNTGTLKLQSGERVRIQHVEGLMLLVSK